MTERDTVSIQTAYLEIEAIDPEDRSKNFKHVELESHRAQRSFEYAQSCRA